MSDLDDDGDGLFYDDFDEEEPEDFDDEDFDDEGEPADDDRLDPSTQQPDEPGKEFPVTFLHRGPIRLAEPGDAKPPPEPAATAGEPQVDANGRPQLIYNRRQLAPITESDASGPDGKRGLVYRGMKERYAGGTQ